MRRQRWIAILAILAVLASARIGLAQQQGSPHVGYVYPAGGQQGTTFQVVIGGQFLNADSEVHLTESGVQATVVDFTKPLTPAQFSLARDQLKELLEKRATANGTGPGVNPGARTTTQPGGQAATRPVWTPEDDKKLAELRKKLANPPKRNNNPAIAETVTVKVTVDAKAPPGQRELRLKTPQGLTNPLVFEIGTLPEFSQSSVAPPFRAVEDKTPGRSPVPPTPAPAGLPEALTLPAIVNGQIMPGAAEHFRFQARKGQKLVVVARARALIPYLADAVPGWFQAAMTLSDAKGHELAYADHYRFDPDPVIFFEVPADGEYSLEIRDSIYRGREDFVYRIALGELPFVTSIFPLGGKAGAPTTIELTGWNLPAATITQDLRNKGPGIYPLTAVKGTPIFGSKVAWGVDTLPECLEKSPNDATDNAQALTLPIVVNGRVDKPGVWHVFRFEGRAGQDIVAEVVARRLGSPLDSVLKLTDAAGKELAFNDDYDDKAAGLLTHQADSYLRATLPAGGTYYLYLGDAQRRGGPEYGFRLRVSAPRPDFELRVTPSDLNVRGGANAPLTVYAIRRDGFSGEIALALKDAPPGFSLGGGKVPANQDQVQLTLKAPAAAFAEPLSLSLEGRAAIQGQPVMRLAVPAEDMMQAFAYRHLVPARELLVDVLQRRMARNDVKILSPTPLKLQPGSTAKLLIGLPASTLLGKIQLELNDPPDGVTIQSTAPVRDGTEVLLQCDAAKAKVGAKGNLIVNILLEPTPPAGQEKPQAAPEGRRRVPIGAVPAVPFEIVAR